MTLPEKVNVEAAANFLANLEAAGEFFRAHDASTATSRFSSLKAQLRGMLSILAWSPASGRPARFLAAKSAQSALKLAAVLQLAEQAGLPELREYVVGQHIVLYAHSDSDLVLLALKHQKQLMYSAEA